MQAVGVKERGNFFPTLVPIEDVFIYSLHSTGFYLLLQTTHHTLQVGSGDGVRERGKGKGKLIAGDFSNKFYEKVTFRDLIREFPCC